MDKTIVIEGQDNIAAVRLLALRGALKLETLGLRRRGRSALSIVKAETGLRGTAATVLPRFEALLRQQGILR